MDTAKIGDIVIGAYHEMPNGEIAFIWQASLTDFSYRTCDGEDYHEFENQPLSLTADWKIRRDLNDFPNTFDPRLPYAFDLYWDIKRVSQLKYYLENENDCELSVEDFVDIKELIIKHNIKLN